MVYLSSIGCTPLIAMNLAEFLIDLANGNIKDKLLPGVTRFEAKDGRPSPGDVHEVITGSLSLFLCFSLLF